MLTWDYWHPSYCNFTGKVPDILTKISFKSMIFKDFYASARGQWVTICLRCMYIWRNHCLAIYRLVIMVHYMQLHNQQVYYLIQVVMTSWHVNAFCSSGPPVAGGFPSQRSSDADVYFMVKCWTNIRFTDGMRRNDTHCDVTVTSFIHFHSRKCMKIS